MGRPTLIIEKSNGNLGRKVSTNDMITAVCMNAIATASMVAGTIYQLNSIDDVEALGLNAEYDDTNSVLVYHRLRKLFFNNPSIIVYFMPVAQTVTLTQMYDKTNNYLAKILKDKAGIINLAFCALNPITSYTPTITTGMDGDSVTAIAKAQELATFEFSKDRYCEIFVEGRAFSGTASAVVDLRNLAEACPDVSIVIGNDHDVAIQKAIYNKYAGVEDVVSMVSLADVSQNAGELIDKFSLTSTVNGFYLNAGLSSGAHIDTYSDDNLDLLNDKGYIFMIIVPGIAGYHLNDTHNCDKLTSDYAYIENNRTIKKAIRLARIAVLPRVKGRLYVNPTTGQLRAEDSKDIEVTTQEALRPMLASGDISGGIDCYVDPTQNILTTSRLDIELTFVPVAIGRQIKIKIGFNNPLKN